MKFRSQDSSTAPPQASDNAPVFLGTSPRASLNDALVDLNATDELDKSDQYMKVDTERANGTYTSGQSQFLTARANQLDIAPVPHTESPGKVKEQQR